MYFRLQDPREIRAFYVITGLVEYNNGHFVAYVKHQTGWIKYDDAVVIHLEIGVGTMWPRLIFWEKFQERRVAPRIRTETSEDQRHAMERTGNGHVVRIDAEVVGRARKRLRMEKR